MAHHQDLIQEELGFHLSVKEGLSELEQAEYWAKSAGTARGLLCASQRLKNKNGIESLRDEVESCLYSLESKEAIIVGPDGDMEEWLNLGFVFGLCRAWAIVNDDSPILTEDYGPGRSR